jgi:hypothetical protein
MHILELDVCPILGSTNDVEWRFFLLQFSTVRTRPTCRQLAWHVALALETLALEDITGEMVSEVMPGLELICLEGQPASHVEKFIAAHQLSDRPVTCNGHQIKGILSTTRFLHQQIRI